MRWLVLVACLVVLFGCAGGSVLAIEWDRDVKSCHVQTDREIVAKEADYRASVIARCCTDVGGTHVGWEQRPWHWIAYPQGKEDIGSRDDMAVPLCKF